MHKVLGEPSDVTPISHWKGVNINVEASSKLPSKKIEPTLDLLAKRTKEVQRRKRDGDPSLDPTGEIVFQFVKATAETQTVVEKLAVVDIAAATGLNEEQVASYGRTLRPIFSMEGKGNGKKLIFNYTEPVTRLIYPKLGGHLRTS